MVVSSRRPSGSLHRLQCRPPALAAGGPAVPVALVAVVAALVAGCSASPSAPTPSQVASATSAGGGSTTVVEPPPSQGPTTAPTVASSPAQPAPSSTAEVSGSAAPEPSTAPSAASATGSGAPAGQGAAVVKVIRFADRGSFDRVVIEFQGTFGAWAVSYVNEVVSDPEGKQVKLAGSASISVRVQKATFDNLFQAGDGIPHLSYTGPRRMAAGLANVQEIADAGDFEAVIGLGIGVSHKAGLRAYRLAGPSRLVIDIAH
jgi:hypothetical protein